MRIGSEEERRLIEEDLIRGLRPPMNDVMMPRGELDLPNTPLLRKNWIFRRKVENFFRGMFGMKPKETVATYHNTHRHHDAPPHVEPHRYWKKSA
jgi:hypothetical protein